MASTKWRGGLAINKLKISFLKKPTKIGDFFVLFQLYQTFKLVCVLIEPVISKIFSQIKSVIRGL